MRPSTPCMRPFVRYDRAIPWNSSSRESDWSFATGTGASWVDWPRPMSIPRGCRCVEARVAAIVARRLEDTEADYRDAVRCDHWEVVVPELVFDVDD